MNPFTWELSNWRIYRSRDVNNGFQSRENERLLFISVLLDKYRDLFNPVPTVYSHVLCTWKPFKQAGILLCSNHTDRHKENQGVLLCPLLQLWWQWHWFWMCSNSTWTVHPTKAKLGVVEVYFNKTIVKIKLLVQPTALRKSYH